MYITLQKWTLHVLKDRTLSKLQDNSIRTELSPNFLLISLFYSIYPSIPHSHIVNSQSLIIILTALGWYEFIFLSAGQLVIISFKCPHCFSLCPSGCVVQTSLLDQLQKHSPTIICSMSTASVQTSGSFSFLSAVMSVLTTTDCCTASTFYYGFSNQLCLD